MPHDVFISHSTKDKPAADAICAALETARIRCWIAPRDVLPGIAFSGQIKRAIEQCKVVVLVFSSHSNTSEDVLREVQLAARNRCHIVNFRIENVNINDDLDYYLTVPHWLDALTSPMERHYTELAGSVKALIKLDRSTETIGVGGGAKTETDSAVREKPKPGPGPSDPLGEKSRPEPGTGNGPPPVPSALTRAMKGLWPGL
jgi:hypothetical protein